MTISRINTQSIFRTESVGKILTSDVANLKLLGSTGIYHPKNSPTKRELQLKYDLTQNVSLNHDEFWGIVVQNNLKMSCKVCWDCPHLCRVESRQFLKIPLKSTYELVNHGESPVFHGEISWNPPFFHRKIMWRFPWNPPLKSTFVWWWIKVPGARSTAEGPRAHGAGGQMTLEVLFWWRYPVLSVELKIHRNPMIVQ